MSKSSSSLCFLRSLASSHPDIPLPHGQEVILGRGPQTKITDSRWISVWFSYLDSNMYCLDVAENN